ncbi:nucleotidyltransferase domain-containing protein [Candidatus Woesearchaeota archaeon]|nr:nucleotidyltransferase domain-containing protein [Candidatus Woesearchaeota archaeon]
MGSPSKEEKILNLIFENSPLRQWHFNEIVEEAKVNRSVVNKWLKRYVKEGLLKKIKEKRKFSYFSAGKENIVYQTRKRIYALEKIYQSGLIEHLINLKDVKTAIIFGSMARGDWYKDSDIDLFIYGDSRDIEKNKYEAKLKREIEIHIFKNKEEIKNVKTGLINNVINGYLIKGEIQDLI